MLCCSVQGAVLVSICLTYPSSGRSGWLPGVSWALCVSARRRWRSAPERERPAAF